MTEKTMRYEERLEQLYKKQIQGDMLDEQDFQQLKELVEHPKDPMDSICFVRIMYLYGKHYMDTDQKAAARYCGMRIRSMFQLQAKKRMNRPKFLDFKVIVADDDMLAFMNERTVFVEDTYAFIQKRLWMIIGLFTVILGSGFLLLKISLPVALVVCFMFAIFNYILMFPKLKKKFDRKQTLALVDYVDAELKEMDRPILYS